MANKSIVKKSDALPWLKPFQYKPGQSGNPKGMPKGHKYSLRAVVKAALNRGGYTLAIKKMKERGVTMNGATHGDVVAAVLLWNAEHGDMEAIKEVIKLTEIPLSGIPNPDDLDTEGNAINVTVNVVKNTQNILDVKSKEIKE